MLHIAFLRIALTSMFRRKKNVIRNNYNATWTPSHERKTPSIFANNSDIFGMATVM